MRLLLALFYRYRVLLAFLGLEALCFWLVIRNNTYQSAAFFTSSNALIGQVHQTTDYVTTFFTLPTANEALLAENSRLRSELESRKTDSTHYAKFYEVSALAQYQYIGAKVINNSLFHTKNYITINKGKKHGIKEGMGVVSRQGIVGKVKACSDNYSTISSLLHSDIQVASKLKKNKSICTTQWDMVDYREASLKEVSRHIVIVKGDTVVSSGYSGVYPEDYPIGVVSSVNNQSNNSFWNVKIRLATNFATLDYVYVIIDKNKAELDSLEAALK